MTKVDLATLNAACQYVPVFGVIPSALSIFTKCAVIPFKGRENVWKNRALYEIDRMHPIRLMLGLLSIIAIGSLILGVYDLINRRYNDKAYVIRALQTKQVGFCPNKISSHLLDDEEVAKALVLRAVMHWDLLSERIQKNEDFALKMIKDRPHVVKLYREKVLLDETFERKALTTNVETLPLLSDSVKDNEELVGLALDQNGLLLASASERLKKKRGVVFRACRQNIHALRYADKSLLQSWSFGRLASLRFGGEVHRYLISSKGGLQRLLPSCPSLPSIWDDNDPTSLLKMLGAATIAASYGYILHNYFYEQQ